MHPLGREIKKRLEIIENNREDHSTVMGEAHEISVFLAKGIIDFYSLVEIEQAARLIIEDHIKNWQ